MGSPDDDPMFSDELIERLPSFELHVLDSLLRWAVAERTEAVAFGEGDHADQCNDLAAAIAEERDRRRVADRAFYDVLIAPAELVADDG